MSLFSSKSTSTIQTDSRQYQNSFNDTLNKAVNLSGLGDVTLTIGGSAPTEQIVSKENILPIVAMAAGALALWRILK